MPPVKTPDEIKAQLAGPVNSIPTTFLPDGQIDWQGIGHIIDIGIAGGSNVSLLTYGDSQFDFLSDEEVAQLTRFLIDRVDHRALTVAATRRCAGGVAGLEVVAGGAHPAHRFVPAQPDRELEQFGRGRRR